MCKEPRMFTCLYLRSVWSALLFSIWFLMLSLEFVCYNEDMERCHMAGPPPHLPPVSLSSHSAHLFIWMLLVITSVSWKCWMQQIHVHDVMLLLLTVLDMSQDLCQRPWRWRHCDFSKYQELLAQDLQSMVTPPVNLKSQIYLFIFLHRPEGAEGKYSSRKCGALLSLTSLGIFPCLQYK